MDRFGEMRTFVRVVDTGSFSAAARLLHVGQPAISKTVAQLEARLGVSLLVRSTRGLAPTEPGLRYAERARRALEEADAAEQAARGEGKALCGVLRASASPTFARLHVIPRLPGFLAAHPELEVDLVLDDRVIDLVEEGIDVAVRLGDLPDSTATARRLGTSQRHVLATSAYLAREGTPELPCDLLAHEAVVASQGRTRSWTFTQGSSVVSVAVHGRLRLNNAEGIRAAVLADLGLTIASAWMFSPELESGAVRIVLPEWQLPPIDLWAVFQTGRLASAKARAFADFIAASVAG